VLIQKMREGPLARSDGATGAREFELEHTEENLGARMP
jgi:hypothetical protein